MARILVVEDYQNIQSIYKSSFEHENHTVDVASDGEQALKQLALTHYDALLLDLLMPKMDGLELLRRAKLNVTSPDTKVIVLSNVADAATLKEAMALGAVSYLVKAKYTPSDVIKEVQKVLSSPMQ